MSEEVAVVDGFQVSSSEASAADIKANLEADEAPKDGTPADADEAKEKAEKEKRSKAASELGKAGGKAAAKAKAEAGTSPGEDEVKDDQSKPEVKAKPAPEEDDEEGEGEIKGNPRRDAKARIQQLARERSEVRAKLAEAEARLARLEAERTAPKAEASQQPQRGVTPPVGDDRANGKPTPDRYETYEEYVEALTDHKMEERIKRITEEAEAQRRAEAHGQEIVKRVEGFRSKVTPDILERVDPRLLDLKTSFMLQPGEAPGPMNVLADELITSDVAPQLMLYLTEHEEAVREILSAPNPVELARRVGRIEARLGGDPEPVAAAPQGVSKAKPPIQPVTGSPAVSDDLPGDDVDFDTHVRLMNAREKRVGRR